MQAQEKEGLIIHNISPQNLIQLKKSSINQHFVCHKC